MMHTGVLGAGVADGGGAEVRVMIGLDSVAATEKVATPPVGSGVLTPMLDAHEHPARTMRQIGQLANLMAEPPAPILKTLP
jgi:hypothetical protein